MPPVRTLHSLVALGRRFAEARRAAAAVELALLLPVLMVPLLNVMDLGIYSYDYMQVKIAASAGSEAVWSACNSSSQVPATVNCGAALDTAVSNGIGSTSLGSAVTKSSLTEGFYCPQTTGSLYLVSAVSASNTTPPTCSGVPSSSAASTTSASDYIVLTVTYSYAPVISSVSLASILPSTITSSSLARLQ